MKKKLLSRQIIMLYLVVLLAAFLRLYQLGEVPNTQLIQYIAKYSENENIISTSSPFFTFIATSQQIQIMLSALTGAVTVIALYFFTKELLTITKKNEYSIRNTQYSIPAIAALFLAVSPWHIHFSRIGSEAVFGVLATILTVLFFIKSTKQPWYFVLASLFAALGIFTYQAGVFVIPLLLLVLTVLYKNNIQNIPFKITAPSLILATLLTALILSTVTTQYIYTENILSIDTLAAYLAHFDMNWLFITGGESLYMQPPQMGSMYIWSIPFLLVGFYTLVFQKFERETKILVISWVLMVPIFQSLTHVRSAEQALGLAPLFAILITIGVSHLYVMTQKIPWKVARLGIYVFVLCALLFNIVYFLNQYFVQYNYFITEKVEEITQENEE